MFFPMGGVQSDTGLKDRLATAEDAATRSAEMAIQRCRGGALVVGVVQTTIHSNDHLFLGWGAMALVAATCLGVAWGLRSRRVTLATIGWSAMVADTIVVLAALGNQLSDPTDPIQLLPIILVAEAAARWGRNGGVAGGLLGGGLSSVWAIAMHHFQGVSLPAASITFRLSVMVLMGAFIGSVVRQANQQRRTAEAVVNASRDLVATFAVDGTVQAVNPACHEILGYAPDEVIGRDRAIVFGPSGRSPRPPDVERYRRDGPRRLEQRFTHKAGHMVWLELDMLPDLEAGVIHAIGRDVSERRRRESELRHQVDHDGLTGIWNREALCAYLTRLLDHGLRPALIFVDIDHFKAINDSFGHRTGDQVLVEAAGRLRSAVDADGVVARYAGDEFCVAVDDPGDVVAVTERARLALGRPFEVGGTTLTVTAALGSAGSDPGDEADALIERADKCMYATKAASRSQT